MRGPEFKALYHGDRLRIVNPAGDVGVVTLWSARTAAERRLAELCPNILDPARSRVAVTSNLYGDGMHAMFCNLLFNPQIRHLIAIGQDLGQPTCREITAFLERGLEDTIMFGRALKRIRGEARCFPATAGFDEERLRATLSFRFLGELSDPGLGSDLQTYLRSLPYVSPEALPERIQVDMDDFHVEDHLYRPSQVGAHHVERRRPLDCWEELVVRGIRFGHPVHLRKGARLELLNAKAVITEPERESRESLEMYGFDLDRFLTYEKQILDPRLPEGVSYTYGNRLRGHFLQGLTHKDALATVIRTLRDDPESRRGYISLWDTVSDLPTPDDGEEGSVPCLTSIFFRRSDERLTLTATYRSHNLLTAWLQNVYGLMAIQRHVAGALDMPTGPVTVVSHSLGIDPQSPRYGLALSIADAWKQDGDPDRTSGRHSLREDPSGYFVVTVDEAAERIVAEHRFSGLLIKRYTSAKAAVIERQIVGDMGVSLISHALWLGRELAAKEQALNSLREKRAAGEPLLPSEGKR